MVICGKTEGVIRKAYFEKRLPQLLDEIQAEYQFDEGEIEKLGFYLEKLKDENKSFVEKITEVAHSLKNLRAALLST